VPKKIEVLAREVRLTGVNQIAIQQTKTLTTDERVRHLPERRKGK